MVNKILKRVLAAVTTTQPAEGNAGKMQSEEIPILQYSTIPLLGNACHLGVFSVEGLTFFKNIEFI